MDNWLLLLIIQLLIAVGVFVVLAYAIKFVIDKVKSSSSLKNSRFFNILEYFPIEKIYSLKQIFYLVMVCVFIVIVLYLFFGWDDGVIFISVLDILISIYLAFKTSTDSLKGKIMLFLLIPFASIARLTFGEGMIAFLDLFHIFAYLYFIQVYYRKFVKYTQNYGLGITILLLFAIVLVSFLFTILVEGVSPLDSMVMVSNAFTSNSFDASGNSIVGKLDSLVLAWGGFLLSAVGTATLAVSIIRRRVDHKFDEMEDLIKAKKNEK
ncbi:MAG: hypothetical protein E7Z73_05025 [Methanobrevibacter millerae]|uniref:Uncharacterized protein n=1 Tax=Methanobrevibacter millerae TaxID=230361 RepID=A0A8T3VG10_9EURY|nr:hypothetical protein [Methanobrevibacter millerae]MBE6505096.1 hypothetical protein [Methanobrevibacter millerae]